MPQKFMVLKNNMLGFIIFSLSLLSSLAVEAQKAPHERDFPTRREARRMMKLIKRADYQEDYVRQWYKRQKREPPKDWGKEVKRKDENHKFEYLTDKDFNDNARGCYMVDGVYIGPYDIGINCCSMRRKVLDSDSDFPFTIRSIGKDKDSLVLDVPLGEWSEKEEEECWPSIRGKEISYICNYESEGRNIELISLDDLRKERFPHLDAPVIYTINKFFITHDEDLYKLDKNFIYRVELITSEQIPTLGKAYPHFAIIRIYTHTAHNWHQGIIGVK